MVTGSAVGSSRAAHEHAQAHARQEVGVQHTASSLVTAWHFNAPLLPSRLLGRRFPRTTVRRGRRGRQAQAGRAAVQAAQVPAVINRQRGRSRRAGRARRLDVRRAPGRLPAHHAAHLGRHRARLRAACRLGVQCSCDQARSSCALQVCRQMSGCMALTCHNDCTNRAQKVHRVLRLWASQTLATFRSGTASAMAAATPSIFSLFRHAAVRPAPGGLGHSRTC